MFKRAIGAPKKAQKAMHDRAVALGCIACLARGNTHACGPVRLHHRTTGDLHGQKQLGHDEVVALGDWHHQGVPLPGYSIEAMRAKFGPSLHHHKRAFVEWLQDEFGERSTLALQRIQEGLLARRL
jgi:hypothetical protein